MGLRQASTSAAHPLLEFAIFRNRAFLSGVLAAGFALFAISGVQLVTTQRFQLVEGFTPLRAGFLVAAVALGAFPTAMLGAPSCTGSDCFRSSPGASPWGRAAPCWSC